MANISTELNQILSATLGEEVRGSIHNAIKLINDVSEVILTTGTAVNSASSSSDGFFDFSLYLNLSTYELWKCTGKNTWLSLGILKGAKGETGQAGTNGNKWYRGTAIAGKDATATIYSSSGITNANVGDNYLNTSEGAVYHCTVSGNPNVAKWIYDFTLTGGSGGGGGTDNYNDLDESSLPKINNVMLKGSKSANDLGLALATDVKDVDGTNIVIDSNSKINLGSSITTQLADISNKIANPTSKATNDVLYWDGTKWGAKAMTIPTALSSLTDDSTHRLVTDTEKAGWNAKADAGIWATGSALKDATYCDIACTSVTANSIIDIYSSNSSGNVQSYTKMTITAGSKIRIEFDALPEATSFKAYIR